MEKLNLENVTATSEYKDNGKIVPGGYVCEIKTVTDCPVGYNAKKPESGDFLKIEYDIAEGDFTGYYKDLEEKFGFWGGSYIRSYKPNALGVFKGFIKAVSDSNPGFSWDWDEQSLVGKKVGLVLGPDTYTGMDGKTKTKMKVVAVKSVDDIRSGKFSIPENPVIPEPKAVTVVDTTAPAVATDSLEAINSDVPF